MKQKIQSERLGTEPIPKLLKNLSVPAVIGMFVMALYNVVDTIFISYGVGIEGVAGVTVAFPIMMIMMAVSAAMGIGGASVISRRLGARREQDANHVFGNVISVIFIISLAGVIAAFTVLEPMLRLFGATEAILGHASSYMFPILLGTFFFSFAFATNNIVRSEGNAKFAMMTMIIPAVINIILDPIFIFGLNMGVQGAAIATVISQASVTIVLLRYFLTGKSSLKLSVADLKLKWSILKEVIAVGLPAFAQQAAGSIMMIAINTMLIRFGGDLHVGVFGIIQRIIMFTVMPMMGIMQGMQPIVGYNYGAKNFERLRETVILGLKVTILMSFLTFGLVMTVPHWLMMIFTSDPVVIDAGVEYLRIMFAAVFLVGVQVVGSGLYQALGKPKQALILSLSRQLIFLIPLVLILPHFIGVYGVWLAFPISDFFACLLASTLLYRDRAIFFGKGTQEQETATIPASSGS
ncbi:MATE family efflux transporter [Halalkalibacter akibai]|uniref:Multidrug export protein MepA n=1 Tax=Halalkalibacter akibai (strain ATCC 43226 / DSM 21942 / CIP 109018 / JCM 9157 / 1139) TaxID=1236973 RepID=W4QQ68_HALA3|nr:MATE family efflux transporter [Halalkalibacter akibai]GAE34255.1 multi antimicrobial extrusion protein [Halalkalibacter akibai JCM 9157]